MQSSSNSLLYLLLVCVFDILAIKCLEESKNKLYIEVVGGLGNQLFIICAGLAHAHANDLDLVLVDAIQNRPK